MDNQFSDKSPFEVLNNVELQDNVPSIPALDLSDVMPQRIPGNALVSEQFSPSVVPPAEAVDPDPAPIQPTESVSDYELLNRRLDDLQSQLNAADSKNEAALQYLCHNMAWLVNMLSGVAQVAQNMPGMGGMVAKMLGGGKKQ